MTMLLTVSYIIKSATIIAVLSVYYQLFLKKQTFFTLNRFYLLGLLLLATGISFIHITLPEENEHNHPETIQYASILLEEILVQGHNRISSQESIINFIYISGIILFTGRYMYGLFRIAKLYQTHRHKRVGRLHIIRLEQIYPTFSFFNCLFLNNFHLTKEDRKKISEHEKVHIQELHSIDLVLAEIICIVNWFNPLAWQVKKLISENHEYIADQKMLLHHQQGKYMQLLVSQIFKQDFSYSNYFSCSNLKKRILMMGRKKSHPCKLLNYLPLLPLTGILLLIFACNFETISAESVKYIFPHQTYYTIATGEAPAIRNGNSQMYKTIKINLRYMESSDSTDKYSTANKEKVYFVAERLPDFTQGTLNQWLADHVSYPTEARVQKINGKAYVNFIIEKDGSISQVKVRRSSGHHLLDEEALRVVRNMPDWKPGENKGKTVRVSYTLPINFQSH